MPSSSEDLVARLAHDLRQPLGIIETSAFCINLILGREHAAVHEQLRIIERQVCDAARILNEAVAETRPRQAQPVKTATAGG